MIIFHDNLTAYFVRKYTTEKIKFQKISPGKCKSSNHWRIQGGGAPRRGPPPQQDQFLSFSHTFSPKSVRVRGWHPPNGSAPPPTENPGSATGNDERFIVYKKWLNSDKYKKILFVDTDVFCRDNPFKFMLPHNDDKLLIGQDIGTFGPNWWMRKQ